MWLGRILCTLHPSVAPLCVWSDNWEDLQTLDDFLWSSELPFLPHGLHERMQTIRRVHLLKNLHGVENAHVFNASDHAIPEALRSANDLHWLEWVTTDAKAALRERYTHYKQRKLTLQTTPFAYNACTQHATG